MRIIRIRLFNRSIIVSLSLRLISIKVESLCRSGLKIFSGLFWILKTESASQTDKKFTWFFKCEAAKVVNFIIHSNNCVIISQLNLVSWNKWITEYASASEYDLKITTLLLFGFDLQFYNFLLRLQRSFCVITAKNFRRILTPINARSLTL